MVVTAKEIAEGSLTVVTLAFKTTHDMSTWSEEMEEEREQLTEHMVVTAKEICGRLKDEGFWADFIDPCSGTPHFSGHWKTGASSALLAFAKVRQESARARASLPLSIFLSFSSSSSLLLLRQTTS